MHWHWPRATGAGAPCPVASCRGCPTAIETQAAAIVSEALAGGGGWLSPSNVSALLACYGMPLLPSRVAQSPAEAVEASGISAGRSR